MGEASDYGPTPGKFWHPNRALTQWCQRRFGAAGGRSTRIGIADLARTLASALWRSVAHGVMPEGATLKA